MPDRERVNVVIAGGATGGWTKAVALAKMPCGGCSLHPDESAAILSTRPPFRGT